MGGACVGTADRVQAWSRASGVPCPPPFDDGAAKHLHWTSTGRACGDTPSPTTCNTNHPTIVDLTQPLLIRCVRMKSQIWCTTQGGRGVRRADQLQKPPQEGRSTITRRSRPCVRPENTHGTVECSHECVLHVASMSIHVPQRAPCPACTVAYRPGGAGGAGRAGCK